MNYTNKFIEYADNNEVIIKDSAVYFKLLAMFREADAEIEKLNEKVDDR